MPVNMVQEATITTFMELSGLGRATITTLFNEMGPDEVDFHAALRQAALTGRLRPKNAANAILAHLTGLQSSRCDILLENCAVPSDLNQAIISAVNEGDISPHAARIARIRVFTNLTQSRAEYFLEMASPKGFLESAITKARESGEISVQVATAAHFKILTGFSDQLAERLLTDANVNWDLQEAIVKGADFFESPNAFAMARLRATYGLQEQDAKKYLLQKDVNGDFQRAALYFKVDQVMHKVLVGRQDAYKYLGQVQGDVAKAVQLVQADHLAQPIYRGENADTRNPPDVHHNTHIVAVLGVSDLGHQRRASPRVDGWMVSDFYLWMQVLQGMGQSQTWLSCENPHTLVSNYCSDDRRQQAADDKNNQQETQVSWKEGYLHGDPFEERVVVLSKENVKDLAPRVTLTDRGAALRDMFLQKVEEECNKAEAANEPVLLMAFCHGDDGDQERGGLSLGIDPGSEISRDFLLPKMLASSLAKTPNVKVSLFLTSCYSGAWVITPSFKLVMPALMAGVQENEETYAWSISCSQRHAGGVYTSAFLKELQSEPFELPEDASADEFRTYGQVCQAIIGEANRLCVQLTGSAPQFTQEGGHEKFWKRTGFSLADYKKNCDRLKKIPASDANPWSDKKRNDSPVVELEAWEARCPEVAALNGYSDRTGGYGGSRRGLSSSLTYLAGRYTRSHPGPRAAPSNTALHNDLELFRSGAFNNDYDAVEKIRSQILYRTWLMRSANSYRELLHLNQVPVIEDWDQEIPGPAYELAKRNLPMVKGSGLFQRPDAAQGNWGQIWQKPFLYLSYAFAASGYGPSDTPELLRLLKDNHRKTILRKKARYMTSLNAARSVRQMSEILERTWEKAGVKRKRRSLEEAVLMPTSPSMTISRTPQSF